MKIKLVLLFILILALSNGCSPHVLVEELVGASYDGSSSGSGGSACSTAASTTTGIEEATTASTSSAGGSDNTSASSSDGASSGGGGEPVTCSGCADFVANPCNTALCGDRHDTYQAFVICACNASVCASWHICQTQDACADPNGPSEPSTDCKIHVVETCSNELEACYE